MKKSVARLLMVLCLGAAVTGTARADDDADMDNDDVLRSVTSGEMLPLGQIKDILSEKVEGRIAKVHVERKGERLLYEIRVITPAGRIAEVEIDARSGAILEIENK